MFMALSKALLEEMAQLGSGLDFWHLKAAPSKGLKSIMLADGPHGLRKQKRGADAMGICESVLSTCFPTASALACSWDESLLNTVGQSLGQLCVTEDVHVLLGPGVNLKRTPLCGRNFEYYSEDPILTGRLGAAFVKGVQSQGVGTCVKHFAVNNQERNRMTSNSIVDERTLRELYLQAFEIIVKESAPTAVMSAYNRINDTYASENTRLLTDILRKEWGFDGVVISDWGAVNDRIASIKAGMDIEMPGGVKESDLTVVKAIMDGVLSPEVLEQSYNRITRFIKSVTVTTQIASSSDVLIDARTLSKSAILESIVLLKNEGQILPFAKQDTDVLIVGALAKNPKIQGAGSSLVNTDKVSIPLKCYEDKLKVKAKFCSGYDERLSNAKQEKLINEACDQAKGVSKIILFLGLPDDFESEGFDRQHMRLPEMQNRLVEALVATEKPIVVVLVNGSPVEMPWVSQVNAIVETYLGGETWGEAIWDIIYGEVNPSGKLAETFPVNVFDAPYASTLNDSYKRVPYTEGLYIGYRYYDTFKEPCLFSFGHGLSYTTYAYYHLNISKVADTSYFVSFNIKNTGERFGKEIVQCYISDLESTFHQPMQQLKAFQKVSLNANEEKTVTFTLNERDFAFYHDEEKRWFVESGHFEIRIGASSADIRLTASIHIEGDGVCFRKQKHPISFDKANFYKPNKGLEMCSQDQPIENDKFHRNSTLEDLQVTRIGRVLFNIIFWFTKYFVVKGNKKQLPMIRSMILEMPIRNATMASSGKIKRKHIDVFLSILNDGILKTLKNLLK